MINDPVARALFFQVLVLGSILLFGGYIVNNTMDNLASQGIASGFGFLETTAGFAIGYSPFLDYSEENTYGYALLVSLLNTLLVAGIGVLFATIIGFIMGVARLSKNWLISTLALIYIEMMRNIPLLLQIFFWYFGVLRALPGPRQSLDFNGTIFVNNRGVFMPSPEFESGFGVVTTVIILTIIGIIFLARWAKKRMEQTGQPFPVFWTSLALIIVLPILAAAVMGFPMGWNHAELTGFNFTGGTEVPPELVSLALALATYTGAFIAEIVRAGIQSVSHGQTEAAYALGIKPGITLRKVVIPQALRVIIPPLTSQYLNLTKNSSLAAAIAYPDIVLVFAGTVLMQTGQAVEIIAITMGFYLLVSLIISMFMNWYNKSMSLVER
ncbi:MAG: amino acid ABC transporter permease [Rhodospirillales bacterium]|nr:amino acid ABC transporter permease [Rhodospirillales bacterium]